MKQLLKHIFIERNTFNFCFFFFVILFFYSCSKSQNLKPISTDKIYTIDVAYIEDPALPTIEPSYFFTIFKNTLPKLTKEILGYKINYNLKVGMSEREFYLNTRSIIRSRAKLFADEYIDITKTPISVLSTILYTNSIENLDAERKHLLFGNNIDRSYLEEKILPTIIKNINFVYNKKVVGRDKLLQPSMYLLYTAEYWRIIASSYDRANMILINMPMNGLYNGAPAKTISDGGFVDRLVVYNSKIKPSKSSAVVSIYPLLSDDALFTSKKGNINNSLSMDILSYYLVQTVAILMKRYALLDNEANSIMSEVINFNYALWYTNVSDFPLREPYRTLNSYPDSIK